MGKWLHQGVMKMDKLLILGGTSEGRRLVEYFSNLPVQVHVCVATEYGEEILEQFPNCKVFQGKLNQLQMYEKIMKEDYAFILDATHPYAVEVTHNMKEACNLAKKQYFRILRQEQSCQGVLHVDSIENAVTYLQTTTGNIFVSTGSKELKKFTELKDFSCRIYARVLPSLEVLAQCKEYGLTGKHILCMQGPFSKEMNLAQFRHTHAEYLVTKESGDAGGYLEKVQAAQELGMQIIVIGRKKETEGFSVQEMVEVISKKLNLIPKRKVTLLGIGMGCDTLTQKAILALEQADIVIGAERVVTAMASFGKESYITYKTQEILEFLQQNPQYQNIILAFSGDVGFYSGAKKILQALDESFEINVISGISSLCYFAARLHVPWEDAYIISLHGKEENIVMHVHQHEKCFVLLGGKRDMHKLCMELVSSGLGRTHIVVGECLSYPTERITQGSAEELLNESFHALSVAMIFSQKQEQQYSIGIADEKFIRGKVPMTKREVRTISLSYLELGKNDIVYDIGAGTGSISVEAGLSCPMGKVFAIEKKNEACTLIEENIQKFGAWNVEVIQGEAPSMLEELPPPDKVFIGGSGGNIKKILSWVQKKNPHVLVVMNVIALETLSEALEAFSQLGFVEEEYTQVMISKGELIGKYHLMKAQNPIYILKGRGGDIVELS